ncbi:hypothetical protein [Paraburkholderia mimosarum]|uniref:hypothetical protein n=1 Tax=Paraburkholderia mimosarum TaxID=312026 RepID=UPI00047FE4D6|nr:hypothetical protein [Paraburkholderia mimosarum]
MSVRFSVVSGRRAGELQRFVSSPAPAAGSARGCAQQNRNIIGVNFQDDNVCDIPHLASWKTRFFAAIRHTARTHRSIIETETSERAPGYLHERDVRSSMAFANAMRILDRGGNAERFTRSDRG